MRIGIYTVAAIAGLLMPLQVYAGTSLCVEDVSTGMNWESGRWVQTNFTPQSYIAKEWKRSDNGDALACFVKMEQQGHSEELVPGTYLSTSYGCYTFLNLGEEPTFLDYTICLERWSKEGKAIDVSCADAVYQTVEFQPSGVFVSSRTYGLMRGLGDENQKDSMMISTGKCSVIEP